MADELANVKTAEANLQTQVSAMIADLQRVVKDVQALQASAAGGNDVTADAATITQELNDMSTALANAQASIDAADPAAPAS